MLSLCRLQTKVEVGLELVSLGGSASSPSKTRPAPGEPEPEVGLTGRHCGQFPACGTACLPHPTSMVGIHGEEPDSPRKTALARQDARGPQSWLPIGLRSGLGVVPACVPVVVWSQAWAKKGTCCQWQGWEHKFALELVSRENSVLVQGA